MRIARTPAAARCVAASLRVDLAAIDDVLHASGAAHSLRAALELLDGPISDRTAEREVMERAWNEVRDQVADPRLAAWLRQARSLGLLKRLAGAQPERALM